MNNELRLPYLSSRTLSKVGTGCKETLVICNSIFSIFLNQIKAQRDQKIIVWIEYFPYKCKMVFCNLSQLYYSRVKNKLPTP
jgi:hypothetical protein